MLKRSSLFGSDIIIKQSCKDIYKIDEVPTPTTTIRKDADLATLVGSKLPKIFNNNLNDLIEESSIKDSHDSVSLSLQSS